MELGLRPLDAKACMWYGFWGWHACVAMAVGVMITCVFQSIQVVASEGVVGRGLAISRGSSLL